MHEPGPANRRALVVCTANLCRSPLAAAMLQRALDGSAGVRWTVRSAATSAVRAAPDPSTAAVAAERGIDLSDHVPRRLDVAVIREDGADLVLTMTREHLRYVVTLDPQAWPRTFTLKELARRATRLASGRPGEGFEGWRARMASGRAAADLMRPSPDDDVLDPYGRPRRFHDALFTEIDDAVGAIVEHGLLSAPVESGCPGS